MKQIVAADQLGLAVLLEFTDLPYSNSLEVLVCKSMYYYLLNLTYFCRFVCFPANICKHYRLRCIEPQMLVWDWNIDLLFGG